MESVDVDTWEDFENRLSSLTGGRIKLKSEGKHSGNFLFRGHCNCDWKLQTTLERFKKPNIPLLYYYWQIDKARPEIETVTGHKWDMMNFVQYRDWLRNSDLHLDFPGYDYMIYLRHHGYPSPLLDWTRSPYVAALFAFSNFSTSAEKVSIYVYQESPAGHKGWSFQEPHIRRLGPYITSDKRHFLQKSEYTVCLIYKNKYNEWIYSEHEQVFANQRGNQDLLWKYNIPISERNKVLKELEEYNLNLYSVFGSDESLMATMASRQFHLDDDDYTGYWGE